MHVLDLLSLIFVFILIQGLRAGVRDPWQKMHSAYDGRGFMTGEPQLQESRRQPASAADEAAQFG